ncbi:battenin [Adelges cooleyi]|uniref:battenin n=1 Tax=Adelges cooleyi TaxID=133065 RepID=UPI0021801EFD|nr:battenin [Adelges cooleyi]XP_050438964.1 battenin [Adelges cooleyi]XP_050438965.1 battenin [Adelges cooleyi]XP_050438966.1 battenin [Adelges cooleyi]XP_050438967.1 battenin [Adelges cooleyi]
MSDIDETDKSTRKQRLYTLLAFFLLGLCNNFGYVVMLSSAHDILKNLSPPNNQTGNSTIHNQSDEHARDCNHLSTGVILLADILPGLMVKMISPFIPLYINRRICVCLGLTVASFLTVARAKTEFVATIGVALTSLASGLGEPTLLAYMSYFDRNAITTWSSGTGAAGILGALTYVGLTGILQLTPSTTMYLMLVVPFVMAFSFWVLLVHPDLDAVHTITDSADSLSDSTRKTADTFAGKLSYLPSLIKFMLPLGMVYFFEYLINQGLFELVYFRNIWLTHAEQYRWYQVLYQVGVFVSRSTVSLFPIEKLWILAILQGINLIYFLTQTVYSFTPNIFIVFVIIAYEGLLGGSGYVNTYHNIVKKVPKERREFAMSMTSLADCLGITMAGFVAIPVHNAICQLPV